ncbi:basic amino acid ABC transporter substrate-binding protein [Bacillus sp. T3]|uniref:basic amino acid ABC transporter substrate-binding protein n=1 Tax=Bacillus sp. T3 TaxID=467262 RepID=UPI00298269F9|nr:basic amino acid ABC transporter substrate-binding protein [Bacillus sp. T3]
MRKKFMLMLVLFFSFSLILTACGTSDDAKEDGNDSKEAKKTLRVVTDAAYAPFEYMDKGEIVGFDVDFISAVAKEAGYEINIENVGWDPIFVEIEGKSADLAVSSVTINDERKQSYDFSVPYFLSTNKILVKEGSDIKGAEDLKDKVVAVQNGTTGQEAAEAILGKNNTNLKKFENNVLAIQELLAGGADAVVADNTVVEEYAKNNPDQKLVVIEDEDAFASEFYGILFPKGSDLKAEFDKALNTILDNGTYAKIYKKWFGSEPDVEELKAQQ